MRICQVYQTKKHFKIITQSETVDGFGLWVDPIFILPLDCSIQDLEDVIFESLKNSKVDIPSPKREDYPARQKSLLSKLNETSFSSLYKNSKSCRIQFKDDVINVIPNVLATIGKPSDGLVLDLERKLTFDLKTKSKTEVVQSIIDILNSK